jgi:hypothetical protein
MTVYQLWYAATGSAVWDLFDTFVSEDVAEQQADRLETRGWRCRWRVTPLEVGEGVAVQHAVRNPVGVPPC